MRPYALLVALCVLHARAAHIPDAEPASEKKLPQVDDGKSENTSNELELIDQENTIKDVENKPTEDILVPVMVKNKEHAFNQDNGEVRPEPDLNNPGPPQRQLHETQNPAYHNAEMQSVLKFKQSIDEAQVVLRQGFQGVSESIQHIFESNNQLNIVQQMIKSLREGFTSQINKLNDTIHQVLEPNNLNNENPTTDESKDNFKKIEAGLSSVKNDFNVGLKTLVEGIDVVAALKAEDETAESSSSTGDSQSSPMQEMIHYLQALQNTIVSGFYNVTQAVNAQSNKVTSNVQSDTSETSTSSSNLIQQGIQTVQQGIQGFQQGVQSTFGQWLNGSSTVLGQSDTEQSQGSSNGQVFQNNPINLFINWIQNQTSGAVSTTPSTSQPAAVLKLSAEDVEKQKETKIETVETIKGDPVEKIENPTKGHHESGVDNSGIKDSEDKKEETPKDSIPEKSKEDVKKEETEITENKTE